MNILVRIELLEQEMRSLKNQFETSQHERNGQGLNVRASLKEFEENQVQMNEMQDMYGQLNRMVESLILRIADQEKRQSAMLLIQRE